MAIWRSKSCRQVHSKYGVAIHLWHVSTPKNLTASNLLVNSQFRHLNASTTFTVFDSSEQEWRSIWNQDWER